MELFPKTHTATEHKADSTEYNRLNVFERLDFEVLRKLIDDANQLKLTRNTSNEDYFAEYRRIAGSDLSKIFIRYLHEFEYYRDFTSGLADSEGEFIGNIGICFRPFTPQIQLIYGYYSNRGVSSIKGNIDELPNLLEESASISKEYFNSQSVECNFEGYDITRILKNLRRVL
jgi:hypothetical protein